MADIDNIWKQTVESDAFKGMDADKKKEVRDRFFQRFFLSNPSYARAPLEVRQGIHEKFDQAIQIPKEKSWMDTAQESVIPAVKDSLKQIGKATVDIGTAAASPAIIGAKGYQAAAEATPIKPIKEEFAHIKKSARELQQNIEPSPEEIVQEPMKATAKFAASGVVGGLSEFPEQVIPSDWVNLGIMVAPIAKAAGVAVLGSSSMTTKAVGQSSQLFSALARESAMVGREEIAAFPGLQKLRQTEEMMQLESWLQRTEEGAQTAGQPSPSGQLEPFTQEAKTNFSQLRDLAKQKLQALKNEPVRTQKLSADEMWINQVLSQKPPLTGLPAPEAQKLLPERVGETSAVPVTGKPKVSKPAPGPAISFPGKKGETLSPDHPAYKNIMKILREMNEDIGKKGQVGPDETIGPERKARLEGNIKEIVRRARAIGYTSAEEIASFMARTGYGEELKYLSKQAIPGIKTSVWDTSEAKHIIAAQEGNPEAKRAFVEEAQDRYATWKSKPKEMNKMRLLAVNHEKDVETMKVTSYIFRNDLVQGMTNSERQAMTFHVEKKAPEMEPLKAIYPNSENIMALVKNPTPRMVEAAKIGQGQSDLNWKELSKYYDVNYVKNHLFREWQDTEEQANTLNTFLNTGYGTPMLKHRSFATTADGINAGKIPKTLDIYNKWMREDQILVKILGKKHLLDKVALTPSKEGLPSLIKEVEGSPPAPSNWIRSDHPMLRGKALNPDYKFLLDYIMDQKDHSWLVKQYEKLNATSRANVFSFSMFHPWEVGKLMATNYYPWQWPGAAKRLFGGMFRAATYNIGEDRSLKGIYDSYMRGHAVLSNRPFAIDAAAHDLRITPMDDANVEQVNRMLSGFEDVARKRLAQGGLKVATAVRSASDVMHKGIFDYFVSTAKMVMSHDNVVDWMEKHPNASPQEIDQAKNQVNHFINGVAGGMNWSQVMVSPKYRQALQMALFVPEWMFTRMMTAARIPIGLAKTMVGRGNVADKMATKMALNIAVPYLTVGNWLNYHNTQRDEGKGRYIWDNPSPHQGDIYRAKGPDKRGLYIEPMASVSFIVKLLTDPVKTLENRVAQPIRLGSEAVTRTRPGGYPIKGMKDFFGDVASAFVPFWASTSLSGQQMTWPAWSGQPFQQRKAGGFYDAKNAYLEAMRSHKQSDYKKADILMAESGATRGAIITQARKEYGKEFYKKHHEALLK